VNLAAGVISAVVTVTDGDGDVATDTVDIGGLFTFYDDGPSVNNVIVADSVALDETDAGEAFMYGPISITSEDPIISAMLLFGADGAAASNSEIYGLSLSGDGTTSLKTAQGDYAVTLVKVNDQTIEGQYNGGLKAFSVSIGADGKLTVTQYVALEHNDDGNTLAEYNDTLTLSGLITATVTITDGDGDTDSGSVEIGGAVTFFDDGPKTLDPTSTHLVSQATPIPVTSALNFAPGADGVGNAVFNITQGARAYDEDGNPLSYNGQPLYLHYGQTDGAIDYTILVATTSSAVSETGVSAVGTAVAFWVNIDPLANTYTFNSYGVISNGTEVSSATIQTVGGGNKEWKAFIDLGGTQEDAFLSTKSGDSVNTNNGEIGISQGNSFEVGEGLRIDFVNGLSTSGSGGNEVYSITGPYNTTNSFRQIVSSTNQGNANITLAAIISNDLSAPFYGDPDDVKINLSTSDINVYDANGNLVNGLIMTDNPDGSITVQGIQQGWTFEINSETEFNAVQIDASENSGNFKLGVFSYGEDSDGTPIELDYDIVGTDGDGDFIDGSIDLSLYPVAATIVGTEGNDSLSVTEGKNYILGGGGDDTLFGSDGDDILHGGAGNDILIGGSGGDITHGGDGSDTLVGGAGDDIMTGGAGQDVFRYMAGDLGSVIDGDTITDFELGAGGDSLDLQALLTGATAGTLDQYLDFTVTNIAGGEATVEINVDPAGTGNHATTLATITVTGVGAGDTADSIIDTMINHNIDI
jgi:hypothetical protein